MKTVEQLQAAVDELRSVCERHGVILLGTCASEGIYGEISISEDVEGAACWTDPASVLDNRVIEDGRGGFHLGGIGRFSAVWLNVELDMVEPVASTTARKWAESGRRIQCAYCGRSKFCKPQPHNCNCGNLRKRHLRWILLDEPRPMTNAIVSGLPRKGD